MAIICSCRGIGDKKIEPYLKNRRGEFVRLQEIMAECQTNKNPCCSHVKECVGLLNERVEAHNKANTSANDAQAVSPAPPQYGHN